MRFPWASGLPLDPIFGSFFSLRTAPNGAHGYEEHAVHRLVPKKKTSFAAFERLLVSVKTGVSLDFKLVHLTSSI